MKAVLRWLFNDNDNWLWVSGVLIFVGLAVYVIWFAPGPIYLIR